MGLKVNKRQLAEILGKSEVTLTAWQKEGLPIEAVGAAGEANVYDTEKCIAWWFAREAGKSTSLESERAELTRLQQDQMRLKLAKDRGELVDAAEVEPAWTRFVISARTYALQLRWRLPDEFVATLLSAKALNREISSAEMEALRAQVDSHIEKFLRQLTQYEDDDQADPETGSGELRAA